MDIGALKKGSLINPREGIVESQVDKGHGSLEDRIKVVNQGGRSLDERW